MPQLYRLHRHPERAGRLLSLEPADASQKTRRNRLRNRVQHRAVHCGSGRQRLPSPKQICLVALSCQHTNNPCRLGLGSTILLESTTAHPTPTGLVPRASDTCPSSRIGINSASLSSFPLGQRNCCATLPTPQDGSGGILTDSTSRPCATGSSSWTLDPYPSLSLQHYTNHLIIPTLAQSLFSLPSTVTPLRLHALLGSPIASYRTLDNVPNLRGSYSTEYSLASIFFLPS